MKYFFYLFILCVENVINKNKLKHANISFFRTMIYRGDMPSGNIRLAEGIQ